MGGKLVQGNTNVWCLHITPAWALLLLSNWPHRHYFSLLPSKADLSSLYSNHVDLLATSLSSRINCGVAQIQAILGSHKNILSLLTPGC